MSKRVYFLAKTFSILLSCQALADEVTSSGNISLHGEVKSFCSLGEEPVLNGQGSASIIGTYDGKMVFSDFIGYDGRHKSTSMTVTFPKAICNYAAKLGLKSQNIGIRPSGNGTNAPAGFTNVVHYTAIARWGAGGPTTQVITSSGGAGNNNSVPVGPRSGDLVVSIVTTDTALPLISNNSMYTDVLVVQLGAEL